MSHIPAAYSRRSAVPNLRRQGAWRSSSAQIYRSFAPRAKLAGDCRTDVRQADQEASLDLQSLIEMVYENGRYERTDYSQPPEPPLAEADAQWADQLLREKGLR